jgi:hypothetical protein
MMSPEENKPRSDAEPDEAREDTPGLDRDKPRRSEQGTDHIEDPDQVAEHLSEIDRKHDGEKR